MQKGDINRTGWSPYAVTNNLERKPAWKWRDPYWHVIRSTPLIDDKLNIYLGTQGGYVWKLSPEGYVYWVYKSTRGNIPTVPGILAGSLYGNTASGYVFALDMETGKERWAVQVSNKTAADTACVFVHADTVITATRNETPQHGNNNLVVALNATDGSLKWTYNLYWPTYNFQASSPGDGTVIFQDHFGGLYRVGLHDGHLVWESGIPDRHPTFFTTGAAIVGPNGLVYVASNYHMGIGMIHAYQLTDGVPVWRQMFKGLAANQAVAIGRLAGSEDRLSVVAGIGENPGEPLSIRISWWPLLIKALLHWLSERMMGWPTWLWGTHVLPAALVALDAENGRERWRYTPPPFSAFACAGDEALLSSRLFGAARNHNMDIICLPDSWAQAVIGGDGTVYAGHQDGKLYAVRDVDGDGRISGKEELSSYDFEAGFQGSQAIAPGMLAVSPCGGGLWVWKN